MRQPNSDTTDSAMSTTTSETTNTATTTTAASAADDAASAGDTTATMQSAETIGYLQECIDDIDQDDKLTLIENSAGKSMTKDLRDIVDNQNQNNYSFEDLYRLVTDYYQQLDEQTPRSPKTKEHRQNSIILYHLNRCLQNLAKETYQGPTLHDLTFQRILRYTNNNPDFTALSLTCRLFNRRTQPRFLPAGLQHLARIARDYSHQPKVQTLAGHTGVVRCVTLTHNGHIVSGSVDRTLKIWSPSTGECLQTLAGHTHWVKCVTLTDNGDIVSGSWDNTLKIWEPSTGECLQTLAGHTDTVSCVTLTHNGEVSQRRELPPTLLAELYVNVSAHTAPIIQPVIQDPISNARTISAHVS